MDELDYIDSGRLQQAELVEREAHRALLETQMTALNNTGEILVLVLKMPRAQAAAALEYVTKVNNGRTS